MNEEQNGNPPVKPYLTVADKTLKNIAIAEDIAHNFRDHNSTITDESELLRGVLSAQNATNQLLVTLFNSINEGFQGLDLFMEDIQKLMNGQPLDDISFPV